MFTQKSADFTSPSRQLTSSARDRLKKSDEEDSRRASHSCVLFLCKAVPITAAAWDCVMLSCAAQRVWLQTQSRLVCPSEMTWQVILA